jgi:hypothetical protein
VQPRPSSHFAQLPPQSTSLSPPFATASVQVGAWQTPPEQTRDAQSSATVHACTSSQARQLPPQSTSDSPASRIPFEQVAGPHVPSARHTFGAAQVTEHAGDGSVTAFGASLPEHAASTTARTIVANELERIMRPSGRRSGAGPSVCRG